MKKPVSKLKIISWIVAVICTALVLVWTSMPMLLQSAVEGLLEEVDTDLQTISIDRVNPWAMSLSNLSLHTEEGNLSLKRFDARFDPLGLLAGKVHAVSLSSPSVQIDFKEIIDRMNSRGADDENSRTLQSEAEDFLANPPLQHLRLRDGSLILNGENDKLSSKLVLEGDFHPGLAQLRMDGNLSGLPWLTDVTVVREGLDLFLGASAYFPDLSTIEKAANSVSAVLGQDEDLDLNEWLSIDQGAARGKWTGRVEEDGIVDQFMDFNVTDLVMQIMGLTLDIPQAILFVTPHSPTWVESNFYANANWGENLQIKGLKISANIEDGKPSLSLRVQRLRTQGVLPKAEVLGLSIDEAEFAFGEEGEFLGLRKARLRFSALHLEEGLFNLYDGELSLEWLGEDRFQVELLKANGSIPTLGLNFHKLGYSGEIALDSLPQLGSAQTLTITEAFLGEDQKMENLKIEFKVDSLERIELSAVNMRVNEFEFSLDPANFVIEMPESEKGRVDLSLLEADLAFADYEDFLVKNIQANIKLNSLDPLDSNGTQSIRFDLHAGDQVLENGEIRFELLPSGEKRIETVELRAFGGLVTLEETKIGDDLENLELRTLVKGLNSQELISIFEDLDARMEGTLSGVLSVRNDPSVGWDFYGGALSLDPSESAKLYLNTQGMLTEGLDPKSSEYKNMYLLERALQDLDLESLHILFKVMEDGERLVEMNVRGESEVDGKDISVEYRPKIVGGLDALIQQADLSKWGIAP